MYSDQRHCLHRGWLSSVSILFHTSHSFCTVFCISFSVLCVFVLYFAVTREVTVTLAPIPVKRLSGKIYLLSLAQRFTVGSTICHRPEPGYIRVHQDTYNTMTECHCYIPEIYNIHILLTFLFQKIFGDKIKSLGCISDD